MKRFSLLLVVVAGMSGSSYGQSVQQDIIRGYQEAANEATRRHNALSQTVEGRKILDSEAQEAEAQRQLAIEANMTPHEKRMARYKANRAAAKAAQKAKDDARAAAKKKAKTTARPGIALAAKKS